ncbi:MAG: reductive dehalogenase [Planctomycetes bacterium]|nr:reductive dehalogenase [Planctomycetota bacterium]
MTNLIIILGWIYTAFVMLAALGFVVTSLLERRLRTAVVAVFVFFPVVMVLIILLVIDFSAQPWIILAILTVSIGAFILLNMPLGETTGVQIVGEQPRNDERNTIFSRFYRLKPGMPEYEQYYRDHPENLETDEKIRDFPALSGPGSRSYHRLTSAFSAATFDALESITRQVEWEPEALESKPIEASPAEFTRRIKGFARYMGAADVGVTKLNPAYIYSHIGRSPGQWGEAIDLSHANAIAISVKMDHGMVRHAPDTPTTTETAFKYFEAAKIAMCIARYINLLGYEARAHLDGNYRVMCVPVAADAGLGELGRLGLLITPKLGPRIRLAAVTTNMPLVYDKPITFGVQDFCSICKKCADNCPSGSIPKAQKQVYQGAEKWQLNQDACYRFWRTQGTDCAVCVNVCPYSHPATPMHNLVRQAIRKNALARRLALKGDDLFYGRRPKFTYPLPDWHSQDQ